MASTEVTTLPETPPPAELPVRDRAYRQFAEANDRPASRAEQRLLAALARDLEETAGLSETEAWRWVGDAIDEAVAAGSAYVAPRRVGEIVLRWSREGRGDSGFGGQSQRRSQPVTRRSDVSHTPAPWEVTADAEGSHTPAPPARRPVPAPPRRGDTVRVPAFPVPGCGLTNHQVWAAVVDELQRGGTMPRADIDAWLRTAGVVGVEGEELLVGVPNVLAERRAAGRYRGVLEAAVERVTGVRFAVRVVLGDGRVEDAG